MCRFIFYASKKKKEIDIKNPLNQFALMSQKANAPDGDKQEDGWGIYFIENKKEYLFKSTKAIWEDKEKIKNIKKAKLFIAHARSASFINHKNQIEFNQPFIEENLVFVFNGFLKKVFLPYNLDGKIGAQKIFNLIIKIKKEETDLKTSIKKAIKNIKDNTKQIFGLNFLIFDGQKLYVYSLATINKEYYQLYLYEDEDIFSLSSSPGIYSKKHQKKIPFDFLLEYTL